ncbi:MAG: alanine racemase [Treponema sp.]|nr:alanine racemase [Spirochaetia bacterium]MDY2840988.1 alanine racemase [Treponema sp.]MDY5123961.1 alanine racemase [Treponema sp.]
MNRCSKAIIYKDNLRYNLENIKKYVNKDTKVCVAVKADGYGTSGLLTAQISEELGFDYVAVACVDEGIELRNAGVKINILLLSLCTPEEFEDLINFNITPLVFTEEYIQALAETAKNIGLDYKFPVFLGIDTGMGRVGCYPDEAAKQAKLITDSGVLKLEGMITHFCVSDSLEEKNQQFTKEQYKKFCDAVDDVKAEGINPGICTCGASAGMLNNTDMYCDMVRPGIIAYGYYPDEVSEQYIKSKNKGFDIKPVMALVTKVVAIRHFPKGKTISYGRTYTCQEDTDIAVLPIGYADGLLRRYSPGLEVTINGKKYPVCGRICMDQCMVNIGKNNPDVKLWDEVIIFGPKESGALCTAEDLAKIGHTISYEVMTSLSKRIKREIR